MKQAPYGTWHSPLAAADLASSAIVLNYVAILEKTPYWVESRPAEGGRSVIVTVPPGDSLAGRSVTAGDEVKELTPQGFNVRTRVHEYGGMPYALARDAVYFSNFSRPAVVRTPPWRESLLRSLPQTSATPITSSTRRGNVFFVCGRITPAAVSPGTPWS